MQSSKELFNYLNPFLEEQTWLFTNWGHQKEAFLLPAAPRLHCRRCRRPLLPHSLVWQVKISQVHSEPLSPGLSAWHWITFFYCRTVLRSALVLLAWKEFVQGDYSVTQTVMISNTQGLKQLLSKDKHTLVPIFFLVGGMTVRVVVC